MAAGNPLLDPARTVLCSRKDPNCIQISIAATLDKDINNNWFLRALSTEVVNIYIRTVLLNTEIIKEVQVAGIGTIKTGYII